jgi:hypothetical protein
MHLVCRRGQAGHQRQLRSRRDPAFKGGIGGDAILKNGAEVHGTATDVPFEQQARSGSRSGTRNTTLRL